MALDIVVCIKQVPDPEHFDKLRLDPRTKTLDRAGIPTIINPQDRNALEEALRIRERFSGKVVGISAGPPKAQEALEQALATGMDEAILLCDQAFAGADTLATAWCLAAATRKLGSYDLILCGNETVDGSTAQVPAQLAELLDLPHVTGVDRIEFLDEKTVIAGSVIESGHMNVEVSLPAVLAVVSSINQPRLPTVVGIMEAASKPQTTWCATDVEQEGCRFGWEGSPTRTWDIFESRPGRAGAVFEGEAEDAVKKAVRRLQELGAL